MWPVRNVAIAAAILLPTLLLLTYVVRHWKRSLELVEVAALPSRVSTNIDGQGAGIVTNATYPHFLGLCGLSV